MTIPKDAKEVPTGPPLGPPVDLTDRAPIGLPVQGRYRIVSELGTGAFGTVCRAEDEATGHVVALRLLPPGLFGAPPRAALARQRRGESIAIASTTHPALIGVREFGEAETGRDFAAVELAEGRRLSEVLSDGLLDVAVALRLAIDLGGAVEALHNAGLIHGALRPHNVMVSEDGRVKLMDVELSGLRGERVTKGVAGAEAAQEYLSIEEIRRTPVTQETDIYAFGVILYEMLSGAPPFRAKTREALLKKQLVETPVPLRRKRRAVPPSVESMVALALSKRPERRPMIQNVLNCLWQEANRPVTRWKRTAAIVGGVVFAASIPVLVGLGLLGPGFRTSTPPAQPVPTVESAPVSGVATPPAETPKMVVAPSVGTPTPPAAASTAERVTPPAPAPPASRPPAATRRQPPPVPEPPAGSEQERPAASNSNNDPDPSAIIDWILEQRAAARRGK